MHPVTRFTTTLVAALLLTASAQAALYTIGTELDVTVKGVSPRQTINATSTGLGTHNIYAGVVNLTIGGVGAVNALCIDPFQWASNGTFEVAALTDAPLSKPMGTDSASLLGKLWAMHFEAAQTSSTIAASLQIAVWELVGGTMFTLNNRSDLGAIAQQMLVDAAAYQGRGTRLVALTNSSKQDFVVEQVPDAGATALLFGLGLTALAFFRRRA